MSLFIIKLMILVGGFCVAVVNFVQYREKKDPTKLRLATIYFFGSWLMLILMKVVEVFVWNK